LVYIYQQEGDLEFVKGDIILISVKKENSDWWEGVVESTGATGTFPSNYVQEM
jgi:hypothetical protein